MLQCLNEEETPVTCTGQTGRRLEGVHRKRCRMSTVCLVFRQRMRAEDALRTQTVRIEILLNGCVMCNVTLQDKNLTGMTLGRSSRQCCLLLAVLFMRKPAGNGSWTTARQPSQKQRRCGNGNAFWLWHRCCEEEQLGAPAGAYSPSHTKKRNLHNP